MLLLLLMLCIYGGNEAPNDENHLLCVVECGNLQSNMAHFHFVKIAEIFNTCRCSSVFSLVCVLAPAQSHLTSI